MMDWFHATKEWLQALPWEQQLCLGLSIFLLSFFGSLAFTAVVIVQMPANYFQYSKRIHILAKGHPVVWWLGHIAKNLLGLLLIVLGIVLSLPGIPGQGLLTILIGVMLLDFPGKRRLERSLVRRPAIHSTINRLRARFGKPPLDLDGIVDVPSSRLNEETSESSR